MLSNLVLSIQHWLRCWDVGMFGCSLLIFQLLAFLEVFVQVHLNCIATDFCASMRLNAGTCEMRLVG